MPSRSSDRPRIVLDCERFKSEIRKRGWKTRAETAEHIGISEGTLSKLLSGKIEPSALTIDRILTSLELEYGDLFYREEPSWKSVKTTAA